MKANLKLVFLDCTNTTIVSADGRSRLATEAQPEICDGDTILPRGNEGAQVVDPLDDDAVLLQFIFGQGSGEVGLQITDVDGTAVTVRIVGQAPADYIFTLPDGMVFTIRG